MDEMKAASGCGGTGPSAVPGSEESVDVVWRTLTASHLEEGPHDVPDHVMEEPACGDFINQLRALVEPAGDRALADRRLDRRRRGAEGGEIAASQEALGRPLESVPLEWARMVVGEP